MKLRQGVIIAEQHCVRGKSNHLCFPIRQSDCKTTLGRAIMRISLPGLKASPALCRS
jgi:hypothetical protein